MARANRELTVRQLLPLSDTTLDGTRWTNDIRGAVVLDEAGYEIGRIADLVVDEKSHRVYFIVVDASGLVFDVGEPIIPVDAIIRRDRDQIWVDQEHEHVAAGPRYDRELISDAGYQAGVYGWYGFTPYWHPNYVPPSMDTPRVNVNADHR